MGLISLAVKKLKKAFEPTVNLTINNEVITDPEILAEARRMFSEMDRAFDSFDFSKLEQMVKEKKWNK